ncbi:MAG: LytTR family transcriptional regulator [Bacteroidetes bacterium]|nr:LytTR family transcriptional regulator [Bacteroidota bacterium]
MQKSKDNRSPTTSQEFIFVRSGNHLEKLFPEKILWIELIGRKIIICTLDKNYLINGSMKRLMRKLPDNKFIRVHPSFIVPVEKIDVIKKDAITIEEKQIPLSKPRKKELLSKINMV